MVREIKDKGIIGKLKNLAASRLFIPTVIVLLVIGTIPVIRFLSSGTLDIRQRAAQGTPTASISINPQSGNYSVGQQLTVSLVIDGGGQAFNAAQADIEVSNNLSIQSLNLTQQGVGGCNFTFVNQRKTPSISDMSFAGAILNSSSNNCTLFTATLQVTGEGIGTITLNRGSVKSYSGAKDILLTANSGTYQLGPIVTPTTIPSPTFTPTPTEVVPTVTPTSVPTNTPTPTVVALQPPTIDQLPTNTYQNALTISGTRTPQLTQILVNNSTVGVTYPSTSTWQYQATLSLGENSFSVIGRDTSGNQSDTVSVNISLHRTGDISGDNVIDLTDLSIFGTDWEKTEGFNSLLSDMDNDGIVDLTDFSILAAAYGN